MRLKRLRLNIFSAIVFTFIFTIATAISLEYFVRKISNKVPVEKSRIIPSDQQTVPETPAPKKSAPEKRSSSKEYIVKKGDSVERISNSHGILPYMLRENNGLKMGEIIHPGDILKIPKYIWRPYIGLASWYGPKFHGKKMANTEIYDQEKILIAHRHLPLGTWVKITLLDNPKKFVICQVLDRGPYPRDKKGDFTREVDLSLGAAKKLGIVKRGVAYVRIEPVNLSPQT